MGQKLKSLKTEKPSLVGISLVGVFLATMVLNEIVKSTSLSVQAQSRQMASVNEQDVKKEVSWEHEMASRLSSSEATSADKGAAKPSLKDELLYGTLEGRYNVQFENGKIISLELNGERGTIADSNRLNPVDLLEKYKSFFSDHLAKVRVAELNGDNQTFELIGEKDQVIGKALVELDSEGHVKKLSIKNM